MGGKLFEEGYQDWHFMWMNFRIENILREFHKEYFKVSWLFGLQAKYRLVARLGLGSECLVVIDLRDIFKRFSAMFASFYSLLSLAIKFVHQRRLDCLWPFVWNKEIR